MQIKLPLFKCHPVYMPSGRYRSVIRIIRC